MIIISLSFTPLNIYNGTPKGVPQDVKGQPLPINQLKGTNICDVRANSNVRRCIIMPNDNGPSSPRNPHNSSGNTVHDTSANFAFDVSHNIYKVDVSGNFDLSLNNPTVTFSLDASSSFTVTRSTEYSFDISGMDLSGVDADCSVNTVVIPTIVKYTENSVVVDSSMQVVKQQ